MERKRHNLYVRTYPDPGQSERLPRTSPEKFYEFLRANALKLWNSPKGRAFLIPIEEGPRILARLMSRDRIDKKCPLPKRL